MRVELEGGRSSEVAFYIADSREEEVLLGNALGDLGVTLTISQSKPDASEAEGVKPNTVKVAKRIYIPPHGSRVVSAHCDVGEQMTEGVLWPTRGLSCGVFKIRNQKVEIPVVNHSEEPMILGRGEEIGHWGTEKWKEKWEAFNPCVLEDTGNRADSHERRALLIEQLRQSSNAKSLSEDILEVLDEFPEAFSVSDTELTGTDKVVMDIDTGDNKPIKMKTRPVPLAVRKKLKELLVDLQNRKIIEKSSSEWAFPIVLVEKKDGSLRLCVDYRELNKQAQAARSSKIRLTKRGFYEITTVDSLRETRGLRCSFSKIAMLKSPKALKVIHEAVPHISGQTSPQPMTSLWFHGVICGTKR
ncbi:hypothetical protein OSTOST_21449, partial [Ostertagia ostertagi]